MIKRLVLLVVVLGLAISQTLQLDVNEEKTFVKTGTTGLIVIENKDVLSLTTRPNAFVVKALKPGQATFVVLIGDQKVPYRVTVGSVKVQSSQPISRVDYSGKSFATNLSMGYGGGQSSSTYAQNNYNYGYTYYRLDTTGETPLGFLTNKIYFKNRGDYQGLNSFYTSLKNQYGLFAVGDQMIPQQSSILFPAQPVQGFSYQGMLSNLEIFLFSGKNNFGLWGYGLEREQRNAQDISLAKVKMKVDATTAVGLSVGNGGMSILGNTKVMGVDLDGELAKDSQGNMAKEARGGFSSGSDISWALGYREYDPNFLVPVGLVNYGGYKGMWYNLSYQPRDYFALTYTGQNYQRSLSNQMKEEKGNQIQLNLFGERYKDFLPDLIVQVWDNQGAGAITPYVIVGVTTTNTYVTPNTGLTPNYLSTTTNLNNAMSYLQSGASYMLRKRLPWQGMDVWAKWVPQQVINPQNNAYSYDKQSRGFGVRVPLFDELLTYQGELWREETRFYNGTYTPENVYRSLISSRPLAVLRQDVLFNSFYQFESRQNESNLETFIKHFYKLELQWLMNPDGNLSLASYRTIDDMPATYQLSRILDEIRLEYTQNFNWRMNFEKGKSVLTGLVYVDENSSGTLEANEKGVPNVRVVLSDGRVATSDKNGIYRFENVKEGQMFLDLDSSATKITVTEELPKSVQIVADERQVVNIGVLLNDRVMGYVYVDENQNGFRDPSEKAFKDVRIMVGDNVIKTDENGYYEFVSPEYGGNHGIAIDMSSLPDRYKLLGERKQTVAGSSESSFILEPISKQTYKDDYLEVGEIKPIGKTELSITGRILKPIFYAIINDQKVNLESDEFQVNVPKKGNAVKFKFYTRDKTFWIKMVPIK